MASNNPLVSVILPRSGDAGDFRQAIDSVFRQAYRPIELVVVDDVPPEGDTEELPPAPAGIKVTVCNTEELGLARMFNLGMRIAEGEYFSLLTGRDRYVADRIARCVAEARASASDLLISYVEPFGHDGRPLEIGHPWRQNYERALSTISRRIRASRSCSPSSTS